MPMTNQLYQHLLDMFALEEDKCVQLANEYVLQTCKLKQEGTECVEFETEFCKHDMVR